MTRTVEVRVLLDHVNMLSDAYEDIAIEHAMAGHMVAVSPLANLSRMAAKIDAIDREDRTSNVDALLELIETILQAVYLIQSAAQDLPS